MNMNYEPETLIFLAFVAANIAHLYFILFYYQPLSRYREKQLSPKQIAELQPLSIIMAAKNERENLAAYLPIIFDQTYRRFELIVVNDHSDDDSQALLEKMAETEPRLRILNLGEEKAGKKAAIEMGVEQARYEHLVFIDADCKPASKEWLIKVATKLSRYKIVLGHGRFFKRSSFLNLFERFDALQTAVHYFSFARAGNPYMGVGRNLAYQKSILKNYKPLFGKRIKSGDDDLVVNQLANVNSVGLLIDKKTHTFSDGEVKWTAYFNKKRRQLQAGKYYRFIDQLRLVVLGASRINSWWLLIVLLHLWYFPVGAVLIFGFVQFMQLMKVKKIAKRLGDEDLVPIWLFLEFFYLHWISLVSLSTLVWKVKKWK